MPILIRVMCFHCGAAAELQASIDEPNLSFLVPWTPNAPGAWQKINDVPQGNPHAFFRLKDTDKAICGRCGHEEWLKDADPLIATAIPVAT